jgi:hypothetical protein
LGSKDDAQWYPAEHLTTAPWEMVRKQLTFDILKKYDQVCGEEV